MHHLQKHINQDIKKDKAKKRTQQVIKLNTGAKEIQQVNPCGPENSQSISPYHLINRYVFKLEPS